jgi:acyl-CoA thioester hydrolase
VSSERIVDISLRWGDSDLFDHVNNVRFFSLLEEARVRIHSAAARGSDILENGLVVVEQKLTYLTPLHYRQEPVQVGLTVDHVGGSSFRFACRIFDARADTLMRTGM